MKNGYSILTRRIQGIDINVWLIFLFVILVSGGILVFKITSGNINNVIDVTVVDDSGSAKSNFYPNENLTFITKAKGNVVWDFGDSYQKKGNHVSHSFTDAGKKIITVIANGKEKTDTITISKEDSVPESAVADINPISGPEVVSSENKVQYAYSGKRDVSSFEWTVENDPTYPIQHSSSANYIFNSAGSVTIQLELNNDPTKVFQKTITVAQFPDKLATHSGRRKRYSAPASGGQWEKKADTPSRSTVVVVAQKAPEVPKAKNTCGDCDQLFKTMFEDVARGRTIQDFDDYLCNGVNTSVIANGQPSTIKSVCDILSTGKFKVKSVTVYKNFQQCITGINIQYKKIGLFGL